MPRQSAESKLMLRRTIIQVKEPRLAPPEGLSAAQVQVWRLTVDHLPPEWFAKEQTAMLEQYCRHVARAAQIESALATVDPVADLATFDKLVKLAALESSKITMLARSMRLTQQSRLKAETASRRATAAAALDRLPPWEFDGDSQVAQ